MSCFPDPVTALAVRPLGPESHLVRPSSCCVLSPSPRCGRGRRAACSFQSPSLQYTPVTNGRKRTGPHTRSYPYPRPPPPPNHHHHQPRVNGRPWFFISLRDPEDNWPSQRSQDKASLFFCIVPLFFQRKCEGNQGEFLPVISKAKVTVHGWLFPERLGFGSVQIFVFLGLFLCCCF